MVVWGAGIGVVFLMYVFRTENVVTLLGGCVKVGHCFKLVFALLAFAPQAATFLTL